MKKLITLTSILAAGTLCANAATTLTFEIPEEQATQGVGKINSTPFYQADISAVASYVLGLNAGIYGGGNNNTIDGSSWSSTGDGTVEKNATTNDYTIKIAGRTGVAGEWFASVFDFDASDKVDAGDYVSALTLDLTTPSVGSYNVILVAKYSDGTIVTSESTESIAASTKGNVTLELTETEQSLSKLGFVIIGPSATATTLFSVTGVNFSATISEIPEPSFFGLMAGTLALGLAGTRRRRKAK